MQCKPCKPADEQQVKRNKTVFFYLPICFLLATLVTCKNYSTPAGEYITAYFALDDKDLCFEEYRNQHLSDQQALTRSKIQRFTFRNQEKIKRCPRANIAFVCKIEYLGYNEEYLAMKKANPSAKRPRHEAYAEAIGEPDRLEFYYKSKKYASKKDAEQYCEQPPKRYFKRFKYSIYWEWACSNLT